LHVLPRKFVRIRHFGLLAARNVHTKLALARRLLAPDDAEEVSLSAPEPDLQWWERLFNLTGIDVMMCPACGKGRLERSVLADAGAYTSRGPPTMLGSCAM
jgi:hypothetical protein